MKQSIQALETYLTEEVKLEPHQLAIHVEEGRLEGRTHEQKWYEVHKEAQGDTRYQPKGPQTQMQMRLDYQLHVLVEHYGGDVVTLLALVAHWLYQTFGQHRLRFDVQENNQRTVNVWLEMDVQEVWHNQNGEWVSCEC